MTKTRLTLISLSFLVTITTLGQSTCGFFAHEFFYIDPQILVDKKVTRIELESKGKGKKTIFLDGYGKKIKEKYSSRDTTYEITFNKADICSFTCPIDKSEDITCNQLGFIEESKSNKRTMTFDNSGRPTKETWSPTDNIKVEREFVYDSKNQLDTIRVYNYQRSRLTGQERFKYLMKNGQLLGILHYQKVGQKLETIGIYEFVLNKTGLIKSGDYDDMAGRMKINATYYSNEKRLD